VIKSNSEITKLTNALAKLQVEILEHEQTKQQLVQKTSELSAILQLIRDAYLRLDANGTVLEYQPGKTQNPSSLPEMIPGSQILEYLPEQARDEFQQAIAQALQTQSPVSFTYNSSKSANICTFEARLLSLKSQQILVLIREINQIKAQQLEAALLELQQAQVQLIHSEKMSSLGQLVAGIAHEINNPVNFIYGNINHAREYVRDLLHLVELYQQHYCPPVPEIHEQIYAIDLDFLSQDLLKVLDSMNVGAERIRQIVLSLRNFSRLDEDGMKPVDIHEGIDSTLLLLQNRLKAKAESSEIQIIKEYGNLPKVVCHGGQMNQVFMNLLTK
jgi:signal transduction histidine kinase